MGSGFGAGNGSMETSGSDVQSNQAMRGSGIEEKNLEGCGLMRSRYEMFWDAYPQLGGDEVDADWKVKTALEIVEACWEESDVSEPPIPICTGCGEIRPYILRIPRCEVCRDRASADSEKNCPDKWHKEGHAEKLGARCPTCWGRGISEEKCQHEWVTDENDRHYCHKCHVFQERSV